MTKKTRWRFLKGVVLFCLAFPAVAGLLGLYICWRLSFDPSVIVCGIITAYVAELGLSCLTKIFDKEDKKSESD